MYCNVTFIISLVKHLPYGQNVTEGKPYIHGCTYREDHPWELILTYTLLSNALSYLNPHNNLIS